MDFSAILQQRPHNKHYLDRYVKFIAACLKHNATTTLIYSEKHHICPKAADMFPEYKSLYAHPWNCALLSIKQHNIAHHLLWKAYKNKSQTTGYFMRVKIDGVVLTAKEATRLREEHRTFLTGEFNSFYGKCHSIETKQKISNKQKGKQYSAEVNKTKGQPGDRNYFYGKKFTKELNHMFGRTTVYDIELEKFTSVSSDEYKLLKNIRYYNPNSRYVKENVKENVK